MKIILLGSAGFIGTNLALKLSLNNLNDLTLVDKKLSYFNNLQNMHLKNVYFKESSFDIDTDFENLLKGQDVVFHLFSTTNPTTSNQHIPQELMANVIATSYLLEACVKCNIKKVIFMSSGGTVYGKEADCPLNENVQTYPISSYGIQKITIEKLLYLYEHIYGLDYRIIRLANPYGPYQRPNGMLGAVTTFTYKALRNEEITVYGDGSIVRDFIYIDDAIRAIINILYGNTKYKTFNIGCGYGTSINELLEQIGKSLNTNLKVKHVLGREVDVPVNYLDISRYESCYGSLNPISLGAGIKKTAEFMINSGQV